MKISSRVHIYLILYSGSEHLSGLPKPFARVIGLVNALTRAIWLGLLDADHLNQVTWALYNNGCGFENQHFNVEQGLFAWEAEAIQKHFIGKTRVLVTAAGGGKELPVIQDVGHSPPH